MAKTIGEFFKLIRQCGCGSGLVSTWYKDHKGTDVKACDRCRHKLLYEIFYDKYMDLFEEWLGNILHDPPPEGHEWVWEDLLKEKGCEQVLGLEEAKRRQTPDKILIACPNGRNIYVREGDNSVHILVPKEYAERVLLAGKMV